MLEFLSTGSSLKRPVSSALILAALMLVGCDTPEERAQKHQDQAVKFLSQQEYVKAGLEFRNALKLKKNLVEAWQGLAQIEERNKNWEAVVPIWRTVVELDPKDVETRLKLGRLLLIGRAPDEAFKLAEAAEQLDDRNAAVLAFKAAVLFKLDDHLGASRAAQAALEIDPTNPEALIIVAAELIRRGDAQGALTIIDRQAAAHENNLGLQLFRLQLLNRIGDQQKIEFALQKIVKLAPQEAVFRRQLTQFYINQKRSDDAEKELRALATAYPANVEIAQDLIRFLHQTKGLAAARQELLDRVKAGEQAFQFQIALAEFDFAHGNVSDSIQLLEKLGNTADKAENALAAKVKLAEIQISRRNFDAADAILTEVFRRDSRNIGALRLRAFLRMERGELDAAITDVRQALNDQPRAAELMVLLGTAYERRGSIELADKQYADATRVSDFAPSIALNYVAFLQRRGGLERAEDILNELATRSPNNIPALAALAQVRLARQNWVGAQEIAERIRSIGSQAGIADRIVGAALSGQGNYDESIALFEQAYAASSGALQPMAAVVNSLVRAQKLDQAVAFLQSVLDANPSNAEAHVMMGSVQLNKNAPDQALQSFRIAIERQPRNMVGYRALADFYLGVAGTNGRRDLTEAEKIVRAGLREVPHSFAMRLTLAGVLELREEYDAAIVEYESLLKENPGSLVVANNVAALLAEHRTDKPSLERAYALATMLRNSEVPEFKDTLGWILYLRGDHSGALRLLEQAASERPGRAAIQYHLGMVYLATGQSAKASDHLQKARQLAPDDKILESKISAALTKTADR